LDDGSLDWFWAACERLNIPLMVLLSGLLDKADTIASRHPALTMIIDHMGRTSGAFGAAAFADLDDLLALARHPNVHVKTTSAPSYSEQPYPFLDVHPFLHRIYDAIGPRRTRWTSAIT